MARLCLTIKSREGLAIGVKALDSIPTLGEETGREREKKREGERQREGETYHVAQAGLNT